MSATETTQVEYRQLGKSGLRVSVPILGAMNLGSKAYLPWLVEGEDALLVLKAAWDKGINTIDTANLYSNGESERIIGSFLEKYSIPRNEIIIATKCYGLVGKDIALQTHLNPGLANTRDYVNQSGLSRAAIFNQVDASLSRLKTSYIDLLQIHRYDASTPAEETMKALHDLVESGKVRYIGASSMRTWQFANLNEVARAHGWTTFVSMQDEYSLLYREEEREMLPYCEFHGIGVIPWAPLAAGVLARPLGQETARSKFVKGTAWERKLSESDQAIVSRVNELASKYGTTMSKIALAWAASKITSPIVGISSIERIEQSIVKDITLTKEDLAYLEERYEPREIRGHA